MSAWSRRVATVADGRTGRGSDDGGGDGNVDGGSNDVNHGGIDGIILPKELCGMGIHEKYPHF